MPSIIRAQVSIPFFTDIPRDVSVNVFWILQGGDLDVSLLTAKYNNALTSFYNIDAGTDGALCEYYSAVLDRGANKCSIKYYNLADPPKTGPIATHTWTMGAQAGGSHDLPNQCACVASLLGDPQDLDGHDVRVTCRQGRLYLGPLVTEATLTASGNVQWNATFRQSVADQCKALASTSDLTNADDAGDNTKMSWMVWSDKLQKATLIQHGHVDNAIDSQRRRDMEADARNSWSLP